MAYPNRHWGWFTVYTILIVPIIVIGALGLVMARWGDWLYEQTMRCLDYFHTKIWGWDDI